MRARALCSARAWSIRDLVASPWVRAHAYRRMRKRRYSGGRDHRQLAVFVILVIETC